MEVAGVIINIKLCAGRRVETTGRLINESIIAGISQDAVAAVPNQRALSKIICRKWNELRAAPDTIGQLDVPLP